MNTAPPFGKDQAPHGYVYAKTHAMRVAHPSGVVMVVRGDPPPARGQPATNVNI
jgi:hypothetical protein